MLSLFGEVLRRFAEVEFRDLERHSPIVQKLEFESGLQEILTKKVSEIQMQNKSRYCQSKLTKFSQQEDTAPKVMTLQLPV